MCSGSLVTYTQKWCKGWDVIMNCLDWVPVGFSRSSPHEEIGENHLVPWLGALSWFSHLGNLYRVLDMLLCDTNWIIYQKLGICLLTPWCAFLDTSNNNNGWTLKSAKLLCRLRSGTLLVARFVTRFDSVNHELIFLIHECRCLGSVPGIQPTTAKPIDPPIWWPWLKSRV